MKKRPRVGYSVTRCPEMAVFLFVEGAGTPAAVPAPSAAAATARIHTKFYFTFIPKRLSRDVLFFL